MIPLPHGQAAPAYQEKAIIWLRRYRNVELLQRLLERFQFSEDEINAYKNCWAEWLKPRQDIKG